MINALLLLSALFTLYSAEKTSTVTVRRDDSVTLSCNISALQKREIYWSSASSGTVIAYYSVTQNSSFFTSALDGFYFDDRQTTITIRASGSMCFKCGVLLVTSQRLTETLCFVLATITPSTATPTAIYTNAPPPSSVASPNVPAAMLLSRLMVAFPLLRAV